MGLSITRKEKILALCIVGVLSVSALSIIGGALSPSTSEPSASTAQPYALPAGEYYVNFTESGLPSGTQWYVYIGYYYDYGYYYNSTTYKTNSFVLTNDTYYFDDIGYTSLYTYGHTPSSGAVTVNGQGVNIHVTFYNTTAPPTPTYYHYFNVTGLPGLMNNGLWEWSITLTGYSVSYGPSSRTSYGNSNLFTGLYPGTYTYKIAYTSAGTGLSPETGFITVSANGTTFLKFAKQYQVSFMETGLASGLGFSSYLGGLTNSTLPNYDYIDFMMSNGTYTYTISAPPGYSANPSSGTIYVSGGSVTVNVAFSTSAKYYNITFNVINLPANIPNGYWNFEVRLYLGASSIGYSGTITTTTYTFSEVAGNYYYVVTLGNLGTPPIGSGITPSTGIVTVENASATVNLTILPPVPTYYVNFTINPFPANVDPNFYWFAQIINNTGHQFNNSSPTNVLSYSGMKGGTYTFTLTAYPFYNFNTSKGTFVIKNTSVTIYLKITPIKNYTVSFSENGLQPQTLWGIAFDNGFTYNNSNTPSYPIYAISSFPVNIYLPNGTYYYQAFVYANSHYYFSSPQKFTVSGKNTSQSVTFSPAGSNAGPSGLTQDLLYAGIGAAGLLIGAVIVYGIIRMRHKGP